MGDNNIQLYPSLENGDAANSSALEDSQKESNDTSHGENLIPSSSLAQPVLNFKAVGDGGDSTSMSNNSHTLLVTTTQNGISRDKKGWRGLTSLEKSLSASLGITSTLCVALMIAVIVVGVQKKNDCDSSGYVGGTTTTTPRPTNRPTVTPPPNQCNTTGRPRPPRRGSGGTTDSTTSSDDTTSGTTSVDCIIASDEGGNSNGSNSSICLAPQCFRVAGRIINSIDFSVDPCQNFYQFACGNWIRNNPIPEYASKWDQLDQLEEQVLRRLKDILEEVPSSSSPKAIHLAKKFYQSCMQPPDDEVTTAEMRLLLDQMSTLDNLDQPAEGGSMAAIAQLMSNIRRELNGNYIISLEIDANDKNPMENAIYLDQPISSISSLLQEMGIKLSGDISEIHGIYQNFAKKLWILVYPEDALNVDQVLEEIFDFERNLSRIRIDHHENNNNGSYEAQADDLPTFQTRNLGELGQTELSPNMRSWLSGFVNGVISHHVDTDEITNVAGNDGGDSNHSESEVSGNADGMPKNVILRNPLYFHRLETLLHESDEGVIENFMKMRILQSHGLHGSRAFQEIYNDFRKTIMKNELPVPRWRTCVRSTNDFFGWALSEPFLTVFDEITKEQLNTTVKYVKDAFNETLDGIEWIESRETRRIAQTKIELLKTFLGFPDWWDQETVKASVNAFVESFYSQLNFTDPTNSFQNYVEARIWLSKKKLNEVYQHTLQNDEYDGGHVWPKFVYPTNRIVAYSENLNYLVLPTGSLDRTNPLMESTYPSLHYGSVGVTVAHTMLQSLIGKGKHHQPDGRIGEWWDTQTLINFKNVSECFTNQLNNDNHETKMMAHSLLYYSGALSISYQAYLSQTFDQEFDEVLLPGLQDLSPDQLYFLSFAQSQCSNEGRTEMQMESFKTQQVFVDKVLKNSVHFSKHWNCPLPDVAETCRVL